MHIHHTVFFKLTHAKGSEAEQAFFTAANKLAEIPGVLNFCKVNETSPKNNFDYGFTMEFAKQEDYDAYNGHPDHVAFVENIWMKDVSEFQEIDYVIPGDEQ